MYALCVLRFFRYDLVASESVLYFLSRYFLPLSLCLGTIPLSSSNVYCPYIGVNKDHTPADLQELSDNDLIWGMNKLGKVYEEWDKEFGYIPQSWLLNEKTLELDQG